MTPVSYQFPGTTSRTAGGPAGRRVPGPPFDAEGGVEAADDEGRPLLEGVEVEVDLVHLRALRAVLPLELDSGVGELVHRHVEQQVRVMEVEGRRRAADIQIHQVEEAVQHQEGLAAAVLQVVARLLELVEQALDQGRVGRLVVRVRLLRGGGNREQDREGEPSGQRMGHETLPCRSLSIGKGPGRSEGIGR